MSENRSVTRPAGHGIFSTADLTRRMAKREAADAAEELIQIYQQEESKRR